MGEIATPFFREVLPSAVTISRTVGHRRWPDHSKCAGWPHCLGGVGGGSVIHFHIQKSMVFKIISVAGLCLQLEVQVDAAECRVGQGYLLWRSICG